MIYRKLNLFKDYSSLEEIWNKSKMGMAPPPHILSENGVVVLSDDNEVVGAIFCYFTTGSQLCLIGWPILDESVVAYREDAVNTLYATAEDMCSKQGFVVASTWSSLDHVKKRLENNDWVKGDTGLSNFLKSI